MRGTTRNNTAQSQKGPAAKANGAKQQIIKTASVNKAQRHNSAVKTTLRKTARRQNDTATNVQGAKQRTTKTAQRSNGADVPCE